MSTKSGISGEGALRPLVGGDSLVKLERRTLTPAEHCLWQRLSALAKHEGGENSYARLLRNKLVFTALSLEQQQEAFAYLQENDF